jgi:hypothetical protein
VTTPTFDDLVKKYLFTRLAPYVDQDALSEWLDRLFNFSLGKLLGYNLCIDLKNQSLPTPLVADVINNMSASGGDERARFYEFIEGEAVQPHYILKHVRGVQPLNGDRYVRILPLDLGIEYYFRHALTLSSSNREAEDEVLEQFFNPDKTKRKGLGLVREVWRGRMLNVWVMSKAQLDDVRSAVHEEQFANAVRDLLGFSELDEGTLVGIVYPADFTEGYLPTTLDAHSGCHFFVTHDSAGADWGLTCCLNITHAGHYFGHDGFKERVHESFDGLTDAFHGEIIGEITEEPEPNWSYLLRVARSRVRASWGSPSMGGGGTTI